MKKSCLLIGQLLNKCSTKQTGDLTKLDRAELSVISQLYSQGRQDAFSYCLVGDGAGGGILVQCQITEPNMVYTLLIPSQ